MRWFTGVFAIGLAVVLMGCGDDKPKTNKDTSGIKPPSSSGRHSPRSRTQRSQTHRSLTMLSRKHRSPMRPSRTRRQGGMMSSRKPPKSDTPPRRTASKPDAPKPDNAQRHDVKPELRNPMCRRRIRRGARRSQDGYAQGGRSETRRAQGGFRETGCRQEGRAETRQLPRRMEPISFCRWTSMMLPRRMRRSPMRPRRMPPSRTRRNRIMPSQSRRSLTLPRKMTAKKARRKKKTS